MGFDRLGDCEVERQKVEDRYITKPFSNKKYYNSRKDFCGLRKQLEKHIRVTPIVGFNSQRYDVNVVKPLLMRMLQEKEGCDVSFVVKKDNAMTCIETERLRFLDITNFIAPGYNYDAYLKAYGCSQEKGFFPYEWVDCLSKLNFTHLPPAEAFYSSLKQKHVSSDEYEVCVRAWNALGMKTFKDFLVWYNNLDVEPFLEAMEKQSLIYREKRIDMLKSAISLPGLAIRWMFGHTPRPNFNNTRCDRRYGDLKMVLRSSQPICLFDKTNSDLHWTIKDNLVGGPSIIFHRYHEKGVTMLRHATLGSKAKVCDRVLGVDANALYLYCMMQDLPTGQPVRRYEATGLAREPTRSYSKSAHAWLEYVAYTTGREIRHRNNGGEIRLGQHGLPVDGFCQETNTVYQFHGCFWHAHPCEKNKNMGLTHPVREKPNEEIYLETLAKEAYLRDLGFVLERVWECEWEKTIQTTPAIKRFLAIFHRTLYSTPNPISLTSAVTSIADGSFFGFVECDIHVPENLRDKFSEMAPIFKNVNVSRADLPPAMKEFAESGGFLKSPQRMLIGSLKGEKILLLSELARWYLRHGLIITRIYQLVQYIPRRVFEAFGESVSNARRRGDADPDLALLATTSKLVGNSCYGKTIVNKEKHRSVRYIEGDESASKYIRGNKFVSMDEIDEEFYEIVELKRRVSVKLVIQCCIYFTKHCCGLFHY